MTASGGAIDPRAQWVSAALDDFEGPLLAYATRMLRDRERARDVVQDTFLRLCRQDRDAVSGHLRRWLFKVCRNRALDELRRQQHVASPRPLSSMELPPQTVNGRLANEPTPAQAVERRDTVSTALAALETLPEKEREVIHLKFREGLSYRQIAELTGHSLSYVGVLIHTGMKRLRRQLAPALGADLTQRQGAIR